ncbi:MAG: Smr/MutS family protein [Candidatus Competibacteraceae bacterium]|nr:Smr/MutS family protein [Candidatus Competibacteraceae bacterium]
MLRRNRLSCVRIIHGKRVRVRNHRGPVLKQKVNYWLRQRDEVLAFCSARSVDGGTGAIYLLLCVYFCRASNCSLSLLMAAYFQKASAVLCNL